MQLRILSAKDVRKALPIAKAIEGMKTAYAQLSTDHAIVPMRTHMRFEEPHGATLIMPACLPENKEWPPCRLNPF